MGQEWRTGLSGREATGPRSPCPGCGTEGGESGCPRARWAGQAGRVILRGLSQRCGAGVSPGVRPGELLVPCGESQPRWAPGRERERGGSWNETPGGPGCHAPADPAGLLPGTPGIQRGESQTPQFPLHPWPPARTRAGAPAAPPPEGTAGEREHPSVSVLFTAGLPLPLSFCDGHPVQRHRLRLCGGPCVCSPCAEPAAQERPQPLVHPLPLQLVGSVDAS